MSIRLDDEEINSIISSIEFILTNSTRYDISDVILLKELINLGLPKGIYISSFFTNFVKENCDMIGKAFKENKEKLKYSALKQFPRSFNFYYNFVFKINKSFKICINKLFHKRYDQLQLDKKCPRGLLLICID